MMTGKNLAATLPAQSITLFILPKTSGSQPQTPAAPSNLTINPWSRQNRSRLQHQFDLLKPISNSLGLRFRLCDIGVRE